MNQIYDIGRIEDVHWNPWYVHVLVVIGIIYVVVLHVYVIYVVVLRTLECYSATTVFSSVYRSVSHHVSGRSRILQRG